MANEVRLQAPVGILPEAPKPKTVDGRDVNSFLRSFHNQFVDVADLQKNVMEDVKVNLQQAKADADKHPDANFLVIVHILGARSLRERVEGCDMAERDPYIQVSCLNQLARTKTIHKNRNPVWENERFKWYCKVKPEQIKFECWDDCLMSKDVKMGEHMFETSEYFGSKIFHGALPLTYSYHTAGFLYVHIECHYLAQWKVDIGVLAGRQMQDMDVIGHSDPYVIVKLGGKEARTVTINDNLNPQWNQFFTFWLKETPRIAEFKCWDKDILSDDFMGETMLDLAPFMGTSFEGWVKLKKCKTGALNIRIVVQQLKSDITREQSELETYCAACGTHCDLVDKFCRHCGKPLHVVKA